MSSDPNMWRPIPEKYRQNDKRRLAELEAEVTRLKEQLRQFKKINVDSEVVERTKT